MGKRNKINTKKIFEILDHEKRMNYNSASAFAHKLKLSRSRYDTIMKTLQNEGTCRGVSFNKVAELLENAGYTIKIEKLI